MKYRFYTCDVFTSKRFGGNPLAVLPDAQGLTARQMQHIAREFNYSETTFVGPARKGHTRRVRIFTPAREIPFAGHPNIGTAFVLSKTGALGSNARETHITFEEKAGLVPIRIRRNGKNIFCELQAPRAFAPGQTLAVDLLARALSLPAGDITSKTHPPQLASVGLPFIMVQLKKRADLEKIRINMQVIEEIHKKGIMPDIHTYVLVKDTFDIRTRMFAPLDGIAEDPATGSANAALAALLSHYRSEQDGEFKWRIAQGEEMGRPSRLQARAKKEKGLVTGVWIGGHSQMVSEGYIEV